MGRNYRKHTNSNPLHRWLLGRFHARVAALVEEAVLAEEGRRDFTVLDAGCGEGFVLNHQRLRGLGASTVGLDIERRALKMAGRPGMDLLEGDATELPFSDGAFPLVLCLEVLEHLSKPELALEELGRVSSAYVIASVPNQPYFSAANLLRGKNVRTLGEDPEHIHHWTASRFLRLISGEFDVERVVYPFPWVIALCRKRM